MDTRTGGRGLLALALGTLANAEQLGVAQALTGPIERGDAGTVALHLSHLEAVDPAIVALYRTAGRYAVRVAQVKGSLDDGQAGLLKELLAGPASGAEEAGT